MFNLHLHLQPCEHVQYLNSGDPSDLGASKCWLLLVYMLMQLNWIGLYEGVEARGFIFGSSIALGIGAKFVPLCKPGKLPGISVLC